MNFTLSNRQRTREPSTRTQSSLDLIHSSSNSRNTSGSGVFASVNTIKSKKGGLFNGIGHSSNTNSHYDDSRRVSLGGSSLDLTSVHHRDRDSSDWVEVMDPITRQLVQMNLSTGVCSPSFSPTSVGYSCSQKQKGTMGNGSDSSRGGGSFLHNTISSYRQRNGVSNSGKQFAKHLFSKGALPSTSPDTKNTHSISSKTAKTSIIPPSSSEWWQLFDPGSGKYFYYNQSSRKTTWNHPKAETSSETHTPNGVIRFDRVQQQAANLDKLVENGSIKCCDASTQTDFPEEVDIDRTATSSSKVANIVSEMNALMLPKRGQGQPSSGTENSLTPLMSRSRSSFATTALAPTKNTRTSASQKALIQSPDEMPGAVLVVPNSRNPKKPESFATRALAPKNSSSASSQKMIRSSDEMPGDVVVVSNEQNPTTSELIFSNTNVPSAYTPANSSNVPSLAYFDDFADLEDEEGEECDDDYLLYKQNSSKYSGASIDDLLADEFDNENSSCSSIVHHHILDTLSQDTQLLDDSTSQHHIYSNVANSQQKSHISPVSTHSQSYSIYKANVGADKKRYSITSHQILQRDRDGALEPYPQTGTSGSFLNKNRKSLTGSLLSISNIRSSSGASSASHIQHSFATPTLVDFEIAKYASRHLVCHDRFLDSTTTVPKSGGASSTNFLLPRKKVPLHVLLSFQSGSMSRPLTLEACNGSRKLRKLALSIFKLVQIYMGNRKAKEGMTLNSVGKSIVEIGHQKPSLRDEIYLQLMKQTTSAPTTKDSTKMAPTPPLPNGIQTLSDDNMRRGWELMAICLSYFTPSADLHSALQAYIMANMKKGSADSGAFQSGVDNGDFMVPWKNWDISAQVSFYAYVCVKRLMKLVEKEKMLAFNTPSVNRNSTNASLPSSITIEPLRKHQKSSITREEIEQSRMHIFRPSMFGTSLEEVMDLQKTRHVGRRLPWILTMLAEAILNAGGAKTEGVFRVPADQEEVQLQKSRIDMWLQPTTTISDDLSNSVPNSEKSSTSTTLVDCHTSASLLKLWLRQLHTPLIPPNLYETTVCLCKNSSSMSDINHTDIQCEVIRHLPMINRLVLSYLIRLLQLFSRDTVVQYTKMDAANLSTVFAPNVLRCPDSSDASVILENSRYEMNFIKHLILHWDTSEVEGIL